MLNYKNTNYNYNKFEQFLIFKETSATIVAIFFSLIYEEGPS